MRSIVVRILTQALGLTQQEARVLTPGVEALIEQEIDRRQRAEGTIVVIKNTAGQILAVTRQAEDGRVLKIVSESTPTQSKEINHG